MKYHTLDDLAHEIHDNACKKGWWEDLRPFSEIIALCHSELSEALEDWRNHYSPSEIYYEGEKPCGIGVELADCIIRILDYCAFAGIDIDEVIEKKMDYNTKRPYRHGNKKG